MAIISSENSATYVNKSKSFGSLPNVEIDNEYGLRINCQIG